MKGTWRVLAKELAELALGLRGVMLVVLLPALVVVLVGQLQVRPPVLRTLVVGSPVADDAVEGRERNLLVRLLVEAAAFEVSVRDGRVDDPLGTLTAGDYDLLVAVVDDAAGDWRIFTAETNPRRLATIELAIAGLERALPSVVAQAAADEEDSGNDLVRQLAALAMVSTGQRFLYYPAAAERAHATLPMTIGLIVCFLPFVLVAPSLVRERGARMLEVTLAAPGVGPAANFTGRILAALVATSLAFVVMVLVAWATYGLHPKAGTSGVLLVTLPALATSSGLGLAVSSLARSQAQATAASAVWFLALLLTGGVLFPLERSSTTVQLLARMNPLTAVHDLFNAWMFGAPWAPHAIEALTPLLLQAALATLVGWLAYMRLLRRL